MVLETTVIGGYEVIDFLIVGGLGIGFYLLYAFLQDPEKQTLLNNLLDKAVDTAGVGKDKVLQEDQLRDKVESAMKNDTDKSEQEIEATIDQVMAEVEAIHSQSKHLGKEEEQMKGEDSDDLYNISVVTMLGVVALVLLQIYVHFM